MSELYLVIVAAIFGVLIAILFYIDYRRTPCAYGGDHFGENNWHVRVEDDD